MYDRSTVQGATFNMRGQLYRGYGFVQWSSGQCTGLRVGQPGFQSRLGQGVMPLRRAGKKMRALPLGLAKSICYCIYLLQINVCLVSKALVGVLFSNFCKLREKLKIAECLQKHIIKQLLNSVFDITLNLIQLWFLLQCQKMDRPWSSMFLPWLFTGLPPTLSVIIPLIYQQNDRSSMSNTAA